MQTVPTTVEDFWCNVVERPTHAIPPFQGFDGLHAGRKKYEERKERLRIKEGTEYEESKEGSTMNMPIPGRKEYEERKERMRIKEGTEYEQRKEGSTMNDSFRKERKKGRKECM